jgi:pimeloyl-ACP methyl ester carboxylesterase
VVESADRNLLSDSSITLRDGRKLAFREWGQPNGRPVLFFHGTPDSRHFCPDKYPKVTRRTTDVGVRLFTVDRPGYSVSTSKPGRKLLDWPGDVSQLLDSLGIEGIPIAGHSGGGAYVLACAFAMQERVTRIGLISSCVPTDEMSGWADDYLNDEERRLHDLARTDLHKTLPQIADYCRWLVDSPEALTDPDMWSESDRWAPLDADTKQIMLKEAIEAGTQGIEGYLWDKVNTDLRPWDFSPKDIRVDAHVWQGENELMPRGAFDYLCSAIPDAKGALWPAGHLALMRDGYWGEVLETLVT